MEAQRPNRLALNLSILFHDLPLTYDRLLSFDRGELTRQVTTNITRLSQLHLPKEDYEIQSKALKL